MNATTVRLVLGALALGASAAYLASAEARYEEPDWLSLRKEDNFELRKYPELLAASVTVEGVDEKAANKAFSILAAYIFGKNRSRQKIAMTVPVTEELGSEKIAMTAPVSTSIQGKSMTMKFYMPSKYKLDTLPEAKDERIKFEIVPARNFATIRFSGLATESKIKTKTAELLKFIEVNAYRQAGEPIRAFYNPPWTVPFLRRNEIWIPVLSSSSS